VHRPSQKDIVFVGDRARRAHARREKGCSEGMRYPRKAIERERAGLIKVRVGRADKNDGAADGRLVNNDEERKNREGKLWKGGDARGTAGQGTWPTGNFEPKQPLKDRYACSQR